jgi:hypothetical protein
MAVGEEVVASSSSRSMLRGQTLPWRAVLHQTPRPLLRRPFLASSSFFSESSLGSSGGGFSLRRMELAEKAREDEGREARPSPGELYSIKRHDLFSDGHFLLRRDTMQPFDQEDEGRESPRRTETSVDRKVALYLGEARNGRRRSKDESEKKEELETSQDDKETGRAPESRRKGTDSGLFLTFLFHSALFIGCPVLSPHGSYLICRRDILSRALKTNRKRRKSSKPVRTIRRRDELLNREGREPTRSDTLASFLPSSSTPRSLSDARSFLRTGAT